jgi:hypothetical protein
MLVVVDQPWHDMCPRSMHFIAACRPSGGKSHLPGSGSELGGQHFLPLLWIRGTLPLSALTHNGRCRHLELPLHWHVRAACRFGHPCSGNWGAMQLPRFLCLFEFILGTILFRCLATAGVWDHPCCHFCCKLDMSRMAHRLRCVALTESAATIPMVGYQPWRVLGKYEL